MVAFFETLATLYILKYIGEIEFFPLSITKIIPPTDYFAVYQSFA